MLRAVRFAFKKNVVNGNPFYCALIDYSKNPGKYLGRPRPPRYLDPRTGRGRIVITNQNFTIDEMGNVIMPRFLSAIKVKARHKDVKQLRVCIADKGVSIQLMYEQPEKEGVSFIVIGLNSGRKQNKDMGKKTNQN